MEKWWAYEGLSFSDILLEPQLSTLNSRSEVDLYNPKTDLAIPIISSPMDTVSGGSMLMAMKRLGGLGIHHRYCSSADLVSASIPGSSIAVAPSMSDWLFEQNLEGRLLCIDVAHGHTTQALDFAERLVSHGAKVISGNIVTPEAASDYWERGVRWFRVGIGAGSACTTRSVAAVGVPQLTALWQIRDAVPSRAVIILDGGIRNTADILKALAAGADAVMLGRLLAGADEAPGERLNGRKLYRGMASREALQENGKELNVEGASMYIESEGPVAGIIERLATGIRAGFAYLGARNISELRANAKFIRVYPNREGYVGN